MTPKPSEAELRELARLCDAVPDGEWTARNSYVYRSPDPGDTRQMARIPSPSLRIGDPHPIAKFIAAARNTIPGLLTHLRRLETAVVSASGPIILDKEASESALRVIADQQQARAQAAEKRADRAEHNERLTCEQRDRIKSHWRAEQRNTEALEAELAAIRATPAAAVREALTLARSAMMLAQRRGCQDLDLEAAVQIADKALAGAEAGERKPPHCHTCTVELGKAHEDCVCHCGAMRPLGRIDLAWTEPKEAP